MRRQHRTAFASVLIAALVAASCGGSDGESTPATEAPADTVATAEESADQSDADAGSEEADSDGEGDASADEASTDSGEGTAPTTAVPLEDDEQLTSAGEGGDPAADGEPTPGGEITWALDLDGTGFNTTAAVAPGSIRLITSMVDALVGLDANADWYPNLAESLTPNDDFTSWTITMRPDLTFHDGETVDAAAIAANMQAYKDSGTTGFNFANVVSITAVDDLSVEVAMASPWAAFPHQLVGQAGWMVSPSTIGVNDTFVSTGPFMLESWVPTDSARVVKNPNYWRADEGLPYLDAINFKFLPEQAVRRQAFEAGDIDGFISPADADIVEFLEDDAVDVWIGTAGANEFMLMLNTTRPPFDDLRVRQALAFATDRQFLIDTFRSGLTEPADGPFNPSSRWYTETGYPEFDPAAAQALVDAYEAEVGPIDFEFKVQPTQAVIEVAEVMVSFFNDVGIDASIVQMGQGQSATTAIADDFQAVTWFQFGAPDPDRDYVFFHSSGGFLNWSNLVSAEIDAGLDAARQSDDLAERQAGYAQFQQALTDELPIIWVDHLNGVEAAVTRPELNGIGTPGVFPDGTQSLPMTDGSFFAWPGVWLEQ